MKLSGYVRNGERNNWRDFGSDLDHWVNHLDPCFVEVWALRVPFCCFISISIIIDKKHFYSHFIHTLQSLVTHCCLFLLCDKHMAFSGYVDMIYQLEMF